MVEVSNKMNASNQRIPIASSSSRVPKSSTRAATTRKRKKSLVSCSLLNMLLVFGVLEVIGFHLYFYDWDQIMPSGISHLFARIMNEHGYWISNTTVVYYEQSRYNHLSSSFSNRRKSENGLAGGGGGMSSHGIHSNNQEPANKKYPPLKVTKRQEQSSSLSTTTTGEQISRELDVNITITKLRHMMNISSQIEFERVLWDYITYKDSNINDTSATTNDEEGQDVDTTTTITTRPMVRREQIQSIIPPWSQIITNYGPDPVILGTERCESYRETVPLDDRLVGVAGLFSTGTNVLNDLLKYNCYRPKNKYGKFHLWQVPWGKHNPGFTRQHYAAPNYEHRNQTAVLPIISVRHPITWIHALCLHSYSLSWYHSSEYCNETLNLNKPVNARFGAAKHTMYKSLIHVWRDWNLLYFEQQQYPLLMVRHDDLVYRPEPVIKAICDCVGGSYLVEYEGGEKDFFKHLKGRRKKKNRKNKSGDEKEVGEEQQRQLPERQEQQSPPPPPEEEQIKEIHHEFQYYSSGSATHGRGHGKHRSDLLSAWIKYGQPIDSIERHTKYTNQDWRIIKSVLQDDHGLLDAFHYR